jgi:ERCC4-type nuclease
MLIQVDNRETALLQKIQSILENTPCYQNLHLESKILMIGDIQFVEENTTTKTEEVEVEAEEEKKELLIFERKTIPDLYASIKDGRYDEQSYRLSSLELSNHHIFYLIEGNMNYFKERNVLYSAMLSLSYYKGFSLIRTFNIEETAILLCQFAYKLDKELKEGKKIPYFHPNISCTEEPYVSVIKKCKKDNINPNNIHEIMLSQIPGVSMVTACAIIERYKSISELIKDIEMNNSKNLDEIYYTNKSGSSRKLNKTAIANIVQYLCSAPIELNK